MGSLFRQQYHVVDKSGRKVKRQSKKWYIQFKRGNKWVREPAYQDKTASMAKLVRRQREADLEAEGQFDHITSELMRPIAEHIADFVKHLRDKGNTADYCRQSETRLVSLCDRGGITRTPELTKARVDAALAALTDPRYKDARPISPSTRNHHVGLVRRFAQWLVDERRATTNALASMKKRNLNGEKTKDRRPLNQAEFDRLLEATRQGPVRKKLAGPDRVALYLLASFTGYRRRELSSVTPASFTFEGAPFVSVPSGYSKRRKSERIPLNTTLARFFREYVADVPQNQPLWKLGRHTAEMIQADLAAAGIEHRQGKVSIDFHSLRGTFTTGLARSGTVPKVAQQLARHSDINLTMNTYTRMDDADERAAVERLPLPSYLTQEYAQKCARGCKVAPSHRRKETSRKASATRKRKAEK